MSYRNLYHRITAWTLTAILLFLSVAVHVQAEENEYNHTGNGTSYEEPVDTVKTPDEAVEDGEEYYYDDSIDSDSYEEDFSEPYTSPYGESSIELCDKTIVTEMPEKRAAAEKHFRLNNGALAAAVYAYEIHEQDADGTWQEIDNTLNETTDETGHAVLARTGLHDTIAFSVTPEKGRFLTVSGETGRFLLGIL